MNSEKTTHPRYEIKQEGEESNIIYKPTGKIVIGLTKRVTKVTFEKDRCFLWDKGKIVLALDLINEKYQIALLNQN